MLPTLALLCALPLALSKQANRPDVPSECQAGRAAEEYFDATATFLWRGLPLEAEECIKQWRVEFDGDTRPLYLHLTSAVRMPAYRASHADDIDSIIKSYLADAESLLDKLLDNLEDENGEISLEHANAVIPLYFGIAYGYRELKDLDSAWAYLLAANRLKSQTIKKTEHYANQVKLLGMALWPMMFQVPDLWDALKVLFNQHLPSPSFGEEIVFIVGLPRTGSTLLERMLSRHPAVLATGEETLQKQVLLQDHLLSIVESLWHWVEAGYLTRGRVLDIFTSSRREAMVSELTRVVLHARKLLQEQSPVLGQNFRVVTDKLLPNALVVPLLRLLVPGAKFLLCTRALTDVAVSSFWNLFDGSYWAWTYDVDALGAHLQSHRTMELAFLSTPVIKASLMEVRYERLVQNPREILELVLSFLNLPWNDACLDAAAPSTQEEVRTASVSQVRSQVYQTGMARWQKELKYLRPLLKYLRPVESPQSVESSCTNSESCKDRREEL